MPIQRKVPLRRKAAKKRHSKAQKCDVRGCTRPMKVQLHTADCITDADGHSCEYRVLCLTHAKQEADRRWADKVKANGECVLAGVDGVRCGGPLQAAHGFSRRYLGTRYVLLNGWALCAGHHRHYTSAPLEWEAMMQLDLGPTVYEELRQRALTFTGPLDYRLIADALR